METAELTADDLRDRAIHQAENWLMAFGALIPADQIENLAIKLAADIAKPAIDTVVVQAEQIAALRSALDKAYREDTGLATWREHPELELSQRYEAWLDEEERRGR